MCARWLRFGLARKSMNPRSGRVLLQCALILLGAVAADTARARALVCGAEAFGGDAGMPNDVVCENSRTGSPPSEWDIGAWSAGDPSIQGFANDISVNRGDTVRFKVSINVSGVVYKVFIYRLGYYAGNGARC